MNRRIQLAATCLCVTLIATGPGLATGQTIFHCKDPAAKVTIQDSPCAAGSSEQKVQTTAKASATQDDAKRRDEVAKLRAFSDACTPKSSTKCIDFEKRLRSIESTMAVVSDIEETQRALQLNKDADIVNTRLNHRIAKADYERADERLSANYGAANFSALLAERSEASARMSKARSRYYSLTKTWLD